MTLEDAYSSHYALRYNDIIQSEFEIMNVVLKQERRRALASVTESDARSWFASCGYIFS